MEYKLQHLDISERFKKWNKKEKIDDLEGYILNILAKDKHTQIAIGTDSKFKSKHVRGVLHHHVNYFTVISFSFNGRGSHLIYRQEILKGEGRLSLFDRLWKEVRMSADLAMWVFEHCGIVPEVHLDINPDEKYQSNILFKSAEGFITGLGFPVEVKPNAATASRAADHLCKFHGGQKGKRELKEHGKLAKLKKN
jgi:predicted RNase H-related nuclease YkuK (DUF458 family)